MTIGHIPAFLALAENLHFRRAAETIHLSEPALSMQIHALEQELGVQLFVRDHRRTSLTPAGQAFLVGARELTQLTTQVIGRVRRAARGEFGVLRVGFVSSAAAVLLPPVIRKFRQLHPEVGLELRNVLTADQILQLADRRLDVGFLRLPLPTHVPVETTLVHREPVILLLPASHPLSKKRAISLSNLQNADFVAYARDYAPGFHDNIVSACSEAGFSPHIVHEAGDMYSLVSMVAANFGIALVPRSVQLHRVPGVIARKLRGESPLSEIALAIRKRDDSPTVQAFVGVVVSILRRNTLLQTHLGEHPKPGRSTTLSPSRQRS